METAQQKVDRLQAELDALNSQSPRNEAAVNQTANALDEAKKELEQEQATQVKIQEDHVARVSTVASQFDDFLANLNLGGLTLRQVIGGEKEYQLASIDLKKAFIAQAESFSDELSKQQAAHNDALRAAQDRENQLKRQNENLQAKVTQQDALLEEANRKAMQDALERANLEQSRNNAVAQLEEARIQIDQQKGHIEDLQTQISIGVRGAINVIDTAEEELQKKALADQIRKERTIYDVQWVDEIRRTRKKAKLASTGEEIDFPWTEESKFFVIQEAEVSQFRIEYPSDQEAVSDSPLGNEKVADVTMGDTFPELPRAEAPEVPALSIPGDIGQPEAETNSGVTKAELEERLSKFAQEFGLVKQAVA
jgi:hypothetical protein